MKGRTLLSLVAIISLTLGWIVGYIRLPVPGVTPGFWMGSLAGALIVSMILLLFNSGPPSILPKKVLSWVWVVIVIAGTIISTSFFLIRHQSNADLTLNKREALQTKEEALVSAQQQANIGKSLDLLIDQIRKELSGSETNLLSVPLINQIAKTSELFTPYHYVAGDRVSKHAYSPERGKLLELLISLDLHERSFEQIIQETNFSGADLSGLQLSDLNLAKGKFEGARFTEGILINIRFDSADLRRITFHSSTIKNCNFTGAKMNQATMMWTDIDDCTFVSSNLNGADFSFSSLSKSLFNQGECKWAKFTDCIIEHTELFETNFYETSFEQATLIDTDFRLSNLRYAGFQEANLSGAILDSVFIEESWFESVKGQQVAGVDGLTSRYQIIPFSSDLYRVVTHILVSR